MRGSTRTPRGRFTAVIAHPGAELYGSDRVMLETVSALTDRGWRVVVSTPADGPLLAEVRARGGETVNLAVPVLRKSMLRPAGLLLLAVTAVRGLAGSLRLLRRVRPDVLYVSTVTVPTWFLAGSLTRVPAVAHVHEAERGAARVLRVALALPLLLARGVVFNSAFSRDTVLADLPAIHGRATVVHNGVPGPRSPSPARSLLHGGLRIGYVGRISERKGVDVAVEALGRLTSTGTTATLDIVGAVFPGYEDYEARLRRRIDDLGLTQRVTFHGFRPSVWESLQEIDAVVVPSVVDEPFGNTAVEAVLAARPVVVSRSGGLPEAVAPFASAQVVEPGSAEDLAAALRLVADGWAARSAGAERDAAVARDVYSPDRYRTAIAASIEAALRAR